MNVFIFCRFRFRFELLFISFTFERKENEMNLREFSYNFITSTYMTSKYFLVLMRNY